MTWPRAFLSFLGKLKIRSKESGFLFETERKVFVVSFETQWEGLGFFVRANGRTN